MFESRHNVHCKMNVVESCVMDCRKEFLLDVRLLLLPTLTYCDGRLSLGPWLALVAILQQFLL